MYDAVLDDATNVDEPVDPEMEKFLPMLKEYLRSLYVLPIRLSLYWHSLVNDEPANILNTSSSTVSEYVYDLFYHRPAITDWAAAASNIATVYGFFHSHIYRLWPLHHRSGLPPTGEESDDEDSEPGDSDDEDSNSMCYLVFLWSRE